MNYEDCMLAILANPEDDAPRTTLAAVMRGPDPVWSEFIELQLAITHLKRANKYDHSREQHQLEAQLDKLLGRNTGSYTLENEDRWARDLRFYQGENPRHCRVEFHRGLPWRATLNPYMLIEQGEHILSHIAPLRGIKFYDDPEGAPFPARELAASPLLAHFDEISFEDCGLDDDDVMTIASSPHLLRLRVLDLRVGGKWTSGNYTGVTFKTIEALAAHPLTRKCLVVQHQVFVPDVAGGTGAVGEFSDRDEWGRYDIEISNEGRELERRFGYLPWLHLDNNPWNPADAGYWVEKGVLPLFEPGSPAEAPIARGAGVQPRRKPLMTRAEGAKFLTALDQG